MIILFDLDGTLIDSTQAIVSTFHYTYDINNMKRKKDNEITALIGYPLDVMYHRLGIEDNKVWDFVAAYKERYREISTKQTKLLNGAREAVVEASKFATLGIVTTKTGKYSKILMQYFELMHHFEVLIGREDVERPKPDAQPVLKALEVLDAHGKEVWMIGDTKLDLICANRANVNSIAVLSGYGEYDTLKEHTDIIFNDALEAVKYLKKRKKSHTKS